MSEYLDTNSINYLDRSNNLNYKYKKILYRSGVRIQVSELLETQGLLISQIVDSLSNIHGNIRILNGLKVRKTKIVEDRQNFSIDTGTVLFNVNEVKLILYIPFIRFSLPVVTEDNFSWHLSLTLKKEVISSKNLYLSRQLSILPTSSDILKYEPYIGINDLLANFIFTSIYKVGDDIKIYDRHSKESSISINPSTRSIPKSIEDIIFKSHPTESDRYIISGLIVKKISSIKVKISPGICYIKSNRIQLGVGYIINLSTLNISINETRSICISTLGILVKNESYLDKVNLLSFVNTEGPSIGTSIAKDSSFPILELAKVSRINSNTYDVITSPNRLPQFRLKDLENRLDQLKYQIADLQVYADNISSNPGSLSIGDTISESNIYTLTDHSDIENNFSFDSRNNTISLPEINNIIPVSSYTSGDINITPSIYSLGSIDNLISTYIDTNNGIFELIQASSVDIIYTNPWYLPDDIETLSEDFNIVVFCIGFNPLETILSVHLGSIGLGISGVDFGRRDTNSNILTSPTGCIKLSCIIPSGTNIKVNKILTVQGVNNSITKLISPEYKDILNRNNPFEIDLKSNIISQSITSNTNGLITSINIYIKYTGIELTYEGFSRSPALVILFGLNSGIEPNLNISNYISMGYISIYELMNISNINGSIDISLLEPYYVKEQEVYNITIMSLIDGLQIKYLNYYANNNAYMEGSLSEMIFNKTWEERHIKDLMLDIKGVRNTLDSNTTFSNIINTNEPVSSLEIYPESQEISQNIGISVVTSQSQPYKSNLILPINTSYIEVNWNINPPIYGIDTSKYLYIMKSKKHNGRWISVPILLKSIPRNYISTVLGISNNSSSKIKVYVSLDNKESWLPLEIGNIVPIRTSNIDSSFYRQEWTLSINNLSLINQVRSINSIILRLDLDLIVNTSYNNDNIPYIKDISILME